MGELQEVKGRQKRKRGKLSRAVYLRPLPLPAGEVTHPVATAPDGAATLRCFTEELQLCR
ncbi:hypothetical protein EYF80_041714 [Liparis tanakae]|uniref:Uncharacterized protein n=1 Tax=Liparis tanakae TaxID=230148 RepID=A0A4Z2G3I2_9TELE|nr:hypothetical protein EYF80_041714 [Liparis tanakae]